VQFSNGVGAHNHKELALEILMIVALVIDEGVPSLSFHLEREDRIVSYEFIRELLRFQKEAPEQINVHENVLERFWGLNAGEDN
jgi:hypothetical protein